MAEAKKPYIIALEEHYMDPEVAEHLGPDGGYPKHIRERLDDVDAGRLAGMDEAGIDVQVISHAPSAAQGLDAETSVGVAMRANDRLYETVQAHPDRFAGFATLATPDPKAAANELERAVAKLDFKGAMIHGMTQGVFHDDKRFWPIYERAAALDVPIYVHPGVPHPDVVAVYYKDYLKDFPALMTAGWGFTVETATQGVRLVLSGVFDAYPGLKIILGHLGESLPFSLWRIDHNMSRPGNRPSAFRDTFCEHFYITTSGNFSDPALLCCIMEMGADRILFSIDYPFIENLTGTEWVTSLSLSTEDKEKIMNGNARRLLKLPQ